jgi:NAD(P)-dependent dehydrogenase (short-subunit alcohol dehydrogenase family)
VLLGSRDPERGRRAIDEIGTAGIVEPVQLDLDDPDAPGRVLSTLEARGLAVDVLVNNAAVYLERGISVLDVAPDVVRQTFSTNVFGPLALAQAVLPGMVQRGWGRVVNVSSGAGRSTASKDWAAAYSASKAALNLLTRQLAAATAGTGVLVNAVCPGWVRTDMGSSRADRSPDEGADTAVWLATLPDGGPTGELFRDRSPLGW